MGLCVLLATLQGFRDSCHGDSNGHSKAAADVLVLLRELLSLLGTRSRIGGHGCEISEKIKGACSCQVRMRGIKGCTVSTPSPKVCAASAEVKGWKLGTSSTKRKGPTLSRGLQDRSTTLKGGEEPDMPSSKRSDPPLAHKEEFGQWKGDARVAKRWFWK